MARGRARLAGGITLTELLVALVVAAVLAAIAVPGYRSYVIRAQRTEAAGALLRVQGEQEKYFLQHGRYAGDLTAAPPAGLGLPALTEHGLYEIELAPVGAADAFRAVARPRAAAGAVDDARCQLFSIDQNGLRYAEGADGVERTAECWR